MIMSFRVCFDINAWRRKQSVSPDLDGPEGAPACQGTGVACLRERRTSMSGPWSQLTIDPQVPYYDCATAVELPEAPARASSSYPPGREDDWAGFKRSPFKVPR